MSDWDTSKRKKKTTTPISGPGVAATRRVEKGKAAGARRPAASAGPAHNAARGQIRQPAL
jgi:hypothetical protein